MPQSELNRLLILPAIVLAAALSLSGCANLPFFGGDSGSSNNSSSKDDDDDEDEDEDEDEDDEEADDDNGGGSGSCPRAFLDATQVNSKSADYDKLEVREISPNDFEPASISSALDGGCILAIEYAQDDVEGIIYEAFIPGGQDVLDALDAALVADGYDNGTESFYVGTDNSFVTVYSSEDGTFTAEQVEEQGMGFLGGEFVIVAAYKGEV